jgi:DGQHR domain-containing protein
MPNAIKKKAAVNKQRKAIDPQKLEQLRQKRAARAIFNRMGFERVASDGIEFVFKGRTGELDDIFIQENIIVVLEFTVGRARSEHVAKKSILYEKILAASGDWVESYKVVNHDFAIHPSHDEFDPQDFQVFICYISRNGISREIEDAFPRYRFLDGTRLRYFDALSKTIHRSAKHEFYNYLKVDLTKLGERCRSAAMDFKKFTGNLLPEGNSGYGSGFHVVSFYADPETLLELAYVLRQDSWRDADGLYQRILIKSKINKMRKYLSTNRRVFVNNIIATLPNETQITDPASNQQITARELTSVRQISINIPVQANMIGLIDGQHRVFCYHDAPGDKLDREIAKQRKRQNLLVTGLIFPKGWDAVKRSEFEARLFLEINDTQARAKSALKQSIEIVLNPRSNIAIAKEITNRLAKKGPLATLLQTNFFDPPDRIKTSSIVGYGLRPLVKTDGVDSIYSVWHDAEKEKLGERALPISEVKSVLDRYINFCVDEINKFLTEVREAVGPEKWLASTAKSKQLLTPTTINGFFVCMRRIMENGDERSKTAYAAALKGITDVAFSSYRSSAWRDLGDAIYRACFEMSPGSTARGKPAQLASSRRGSR